MKPKINIDRKKVSTEEIRANKNFNSMLESFQTIKTVQKPFYQKPWFLGVVGTTIVITSLLLGMFGGIFDKNNAATQLSSSAGLISLVDSIVEAPFINPPIESAEIPFSTYTVNPAKGKTIKHFTGSKLIVPTGAFLDQSGNVVEGEVIIKYREFKKPDDFYLSGIPMTYDSAGTEYIFESAGMIEITAEQNGIALSTNPDKPIAIEMISEQAEDRYNLYYLDTVSKKWDYLGHSEMKAIEEDDNNDPLVAEASIKNIESAPVIEPMSVELKEAKNPQIILIKEELAVIRKDIKALKKKIPEKPKKVDKKEPTFRIDVDPKEFPEIMAFNDLYWEVSNENTDFSDEYYEVTWDDVKISEKEKGKSYTLTLTQGEREEKLVVFPRYGKSSYKDACENFEEKYETYLNRLDSRLADEKKKKEEFEQKRADLAEKRAKWEEEMAEKRRKWEEKQKKIYQAATNAQKVVRTFTAESFGIYNSDCPRGLPKGERVVASFLKPDGTSIAIDFVYLASLTKNALYKYYPNAKLQWNPNHKNIIWGVTTEGQLAIFREDKFEKIPSNTNKYNFTMELSDDIFENSEQVKNYLGI